MGRLGVLVLGQLAKIRAGWEYPQKYGDGGIWGSFQAVCCLLSLLLGLLLSLLSLLKLFRFVFHAVVRAV